MVWLVIFGFALKLGLIPFSFWLPAVASAAAPMTTALIVSVVDIATFSELAALRETAPWIFGEHTTAWLAVALLAMFGGGCARPGPERARTGARLFHHRRSRLSSPRADRRRSSWHGRRRARRAQPRAVEGRPVRCGRSGGGADRSERHARHARIGRTPAGGRSGVHRRCPELHWRTAGVRSRRLLAIYVAATQFGGLALIVALLVFAALICCVTRAPFTAPGSDRPRFRVAGAPAYLAAGVLASLGLLAVLLGCYPTS